MKYILLSTIFSTVSFTLLFYLICKLPDSEKSAFNKIICLASGISLFFIGGGSIILIKKMHSTPKAVICLAVAFTLAIGIALSARDLQDKIAKKLKESRKW